MKIINTDISCLKYSEYNPRKLSDFEFKNIQNSLESFGFVDPIVVNSSEDRKNIIIGGHQRVKVAKYLGHKDVPCVFIDLSLERERELNVRLNRNSGSWDWDLLNKEFEKEELIEWGFEDIDFKLDLEPEETKDDDLEGDGTGNQITEPGDLYELGDHKLLCGDSSVSTDVSKLIINENPSLMVTDPPYGVEYKPEWRKEKGLGVGSKSTGLVKNDDKSDWSDTYSLFTGDVVYIWHPAKFSHIFAENIIDCGFEIVSQIIWAKNNFAISKGDYHWKHESCWYAVKKGKKHNWQGKRDQTTLWNIKDVSRDNGDENEKKVGHGTQKPLECMETPILNNTKQGEIVYDPFVGSGTTLIACEKLYRKCRAIEIDPKYCDIIIRRYIHFCKINDRKYSIKRNGKDCSEFDDKS